MWGLRRVAQLALQLLFAVWGFRRWGLGLGVRVLVEGLAGHPCRVQGSVLSAKK